MEENNLKNMVVLKNLPSNLIEEAIVILKSNKKVKNLEKIDKIQKNEIEIKKSNNKKNDYIFKEAELIVSSYVSKLENKEKEKKQQNIKMNKKYNRIRNYAFLSSLIIIIQIILLIIK